VATCSNKLREAAYADLAATGIIGAGANNCNAVQDNAALRPETTTTLKAAGTSAA